MRSSFIFSLLLTSLTLLFSPLLILGEISDKEKTELSDSLAFGIPEQRKKALNRILELKEASTYELVTKSLDVEQNEEVLALAIEIIGELEIKGAEEKILSLTESKENIELKTKGLRTLAILKYKKAAVIAEKELENENPGIKQAAVFALGEFQEKKSLEKLYELMENMDEKEDVLIETIKSIGKIKDKKSIEKLKEFLENPGYSKYIRMYVPLALGDIGGQEVIEILNQATQDKDFFIRVRAIYAISKLEGVDFSPLKPALINALRDSELQVRVTALEVVEKIKNPEYIQYVRYMMEKDPEVKVREKATGVFAQVETKAKVLEYFQEQLEKGSFYGKAFAIKAMENMDSTDVTDILEKSFLAQDNIDLRMAILRFADKKIKEAGPFNLLKRIALNDKLPGYKPSVEQIRSHAMRLLTKTGWAQAAPALKEIAENTADPLHVTALRLLARMDKEEAEAYFMNLLMSMQDKPFNFRYEVVKSVLAIGPKEIQDELKAAYFGERDKIIRGMIANGLKNYGVDPTPLEKEYEEMRKNPPRGK